MGKLKYSTRSFLRESKINSIIFMLSTLFILNTSYAQSIGFGYLRNDGVISDVMYFKNDQWVLDVKQNQRNFPIPHLSIISEWAMARNYNDDVDCIKLNPNKHSYLSYKHICNFPKKLSDISATELVELLKAIKPSDNSGWQGEYKALFTPERLEGIRLWTDVEFNGDRNNIPFNKYTKMFWSEPEENLKTWYRVNGSDVVSVEPKYAFVDEGDGDFVCDGVVIKTENTGSIPNPEGWVSTKTNNYAFNKFKVVGRIRTPNYKDDPYYIAIPEEYKSLFDKIKSFWAQKETNILNKKESSNQLYHIQIVSSEPSADFEKMIHFSARKYKDNGNDVVKYNGYAILNPGEDVKWVSVNAKKMPHYNDVSHHPLAIIKIKHRKFLLVNILTTMESGGSVETQVMNFENDRITQPSSGKIAYPRGCHPYRQ